MKLLTVLLAVGFLFSGCMSFAPVYKVETHIDEIDGFTAHTMEYYELPALKDTERHSIKINVEKFVKDEYISYTLGIWYNDNRRLSIEEKDSLLLIIDNERIELSTKFQPGGRGHRRFVSEYAAYEITIEQLRKIAYASKIIIRLRGSRGWKDAKFNEFIIQCFRNFYETYAVKGDRNG